MGTLRDPSTINNVGTLGGATNPTTAQALPLERENQKAIRELVGTFGYEDLTISSGGITPTKAEVTVDTEAGASADDLTTIYLVSDGTTTLHDGMILKLRAYDPARVVTVKHNTGTNQIQTLTGADVVLGTTWELTLKLVSGVWKEVAGKPVVDITGNAATATSAAACTGNSATATRADTLKQGGIIAPTSAGTSTVYTVTSSPVVSELVSGNIFQFKAHTACGNAPSVNFDSLGAKGLKKFSSGTKVALAAGDIPSGSLVSCLYDGTDMVVSLVSSSPQSLSMDAYLKVRDEKTSGTAGGSASAATWHTRDIKIVVNNSISGASLDESLNRITLPAGTYYISARAPGVNIGTHRIKLYNVTDSADTLVGQNSFSLPMALLSGKFTIASTKVFEVRHYAGTAYATSGLGIALRIGTEIYTEVEIWQTA